MIENQQVFWCFRRMAKVNLLQGGRSKPGLNENHAQRIDVAPGRNSAQQTGLQHSGSPPHERIENDLARFCQPLDKETWQLRFEASSVGHLVQTVRRALF